MHMARYLLWNLSINVDSPPHKEMDDAFQEDRKEIPKAYAGPY
jgi:hypothetical protein